MERVLAGDRAATADFVERMACVPAILRARSRRTLPRPHAEDLEELAQCTLGAIWSKLSTFEGGSTLETWAYGFCAIELLKWRDRRLRDERVVDGDPVDPPAPAAPEPLDYEHVHAAIERVGPPASRVVRLKHFEELTFVEIGERLRMSPNTAKTLYYRALHRLRAILEPERRAESS